MPAKKRTAKRRKATRRALKKEAFTAEEISNALGHIVDWINVLRKLLKSMPKDCQATTAPDLEEAIIAVAAIGGREKLGCPPGH